MLLKQPTSQLQASSFSYGLSMRVYIDPGQKLSDLRDNCHAGAGISPFVH